MTALPLRNGWGAKTGTASARKIASTAWQKASCAKQPASTATLSGSAARLFALSSHLNASLAHLSGSTSKQKALSSQLQRHIREAFGFVVSPERSARKAFCLVASPLSLAREEICFDNTPFWFGIEALCSAIGRGRAVTLDPPRDLRVRSAVCPSPAFGTLAPHAGRGEPRFDTACLIPSPRLRGEGARRACPVLETGADEGASGARVLSGHESLPRMD